MELRIHSILHRQGNRQPIVIAPVGDIQWQGPKGPTAKDTLRRHIDEALQQDAWFLGMGDYIDFLSPSNRTRLSGAALYDSAMDVIDDKAMDLVHEVYQEFLRPTRGRWLGMLEGHHYHTLKTGETTDMRLCQLLGAPFLGTCAKVNLRIRMGGPADSGTHCHVTLWAHHGVGNGQTPAAALNKLKQEATHHEGVDVFLMGHTTKAPVDRFPKLYTRWNDRSGPVELHRDVHLVSTGAFTLSRMQGARQGQVARGGYAEQKMLPPSSIGAPLVLLYLKRTSTGMDKRHRTITVDIKVVV